MKTKVQTTPLKPPSKQNRRPIMPHQRKVVIEVQGGVAEVTHQDPGVTGVLIDHDNLEEEGHTEGCARRMTGAAKCNCDVQQNAQ
jgi:hypothetical protein